MDFARRNPYLLGVIAILVALAVFLAVWFTREDLRVSRRLKRDVKSQFRSRGYARVLNVTGKECGELLNYFGGRRKRGFAVHRGKYGGHKKNTCYLFKRPPYTTNYVYNRNLNGFETTIYLRNRKAGFISPSTIYDPWSGKATGGPIL